jgi:hypothetical protein
MATFGATFCLSKFITFLWFVVGILRFQNWFDVDVLDFLIELCCRYFGFFLTWPTFWAILWKIWQFFSNLLVTLSASGLRLGQVVERLHWGRCRCCLQLAVVSGRRDIQQNDTRASGHKHYLLYCWVLRFWLLLCWIPVSTLPFWWMPWRLFLTSTLFLRRAVGWSNVVAPEFKAD